MKVQLKKIIFNLLYWDYALLFFVFFLIFIVPIFPESLHSRFYDIFISLIYFFAALCVGSRGKKYIILIAVIVVAFEWLSSLLNLELINDLSRGFTVIFFIFIVFNFIVGIARAKLVSAKVILDAINGYLLLAIVYSILIALAMRVDPQAFNFPEAAGEVAGSKERFIDYMYYSLVSITTLGYGDIVPKVAFAKSLATLISITGQFYIAILVALLVGKYASQRN